MDALLPAGSAHEDQPVIETLPTITQFLSGESRDHFHQVKEILDALEIPYVEKPRLVRDLGRKRMLMLRNHGLLTIGQTAGEAFVNMYVLEAACSIQVRAQAGGAELIEIDPRLIASAAAQSREVTKGMGAGALAWPALLRKLDRVDPSWRS